MSEMDADAIERCREIEDDWLKLLRNSSTAAYFYNLGLNDRRLGPVERIKLIAIALADENERLGQRRRRGPSATNQSHAADYHRHSEAMFLEMVARLGMPAGIVDGTVAQTPEKSILDPLKEPTAAAHPMLKSEQHRWCEPHEPEVESPSEESATDWFQRHMGLEG